MMNGRGKQGMGVRPLPRRCGFRARRTCCVSVPSGAGTLRSTLHPHTLAAPNYQQDGMANPKAAVPRVGPCRFGRRTAGLCWPQVLALKAPPAWPSMLSWPGKSPPAGPDSVCCVFLPNVCVTWRAVPHTGDGRRRCSAGASAAHCRARAAASAAGVGRLLGLDQRAALHGSQARAWKREKMCRPSARGRGAAGAASSSAHVLRLWMRGCVPKTGRAPSGPTSLR